MTVGGMPTVTGWATGMSPLFASLKAFLAKPDIGLALAVVAVVGLIVGIVGLVRMESMSKKLPNAVASNIQKVFETRSERQAAAGNATDTPAPPAAASPAVSADGSDAGSSLGPARVELDSILASRTALPSGVDAAGEVENPAIGEPVLLVQSQDKGRRGASLLIFRWQNFDLVPLTELTNATGATFNVGSRAGGLDISTLDKDTSDRLVVTQYVLDRQAARPTERRSAEQSDIANAFETPPWAATKSSN
jgi:hypothetical protein